MKILKHLLLGTALMGGFSVCDAPEADAQVYLRRPAPVRRLVRPPYPVARRAFYGPVYRPWVAPYYRPYYSYYRPYYPSRFYYGEPVYYEPGVRVAFRW